MPHRRDVMHWTKGFRLEQKTTWATNPNPQYKKCGISHGAKLLIPAPSADVQQLQLLHIPHHTHSRWDLSCAAAPLRLHGSRMCNNLILPTFPSAGHYIISSLHCWVSQSPWLPRRLLKPGWNSHQKFLQGETNQQADRRAHLHEESQINPTFMCRTVTVHMKHLQRPAWRRPKAVWQGRATTLLWKSHPPHFQREALGLLQTKVEQPGRKLPPCSLLIGS